MNENNIFINLINSINDKNIKILDYILNDNQEILELLKKISNIKKTNNNINDILNNLNIDEKNIITNFYNNENSKKIIETFIKVKNKYHDIDDFIYYINVTKIILTLIVALLYIVLLYNSYKYNNNNKILLSLKIISYLSTINLILTYKNLLYVLIKNILINWKYILEGNGTLTSSLFFIIFGFIINKLFSSYIEYLDDGIFDENLIIIIYVIIFLIIINLYNSYKSYISLESNIATNINFISYLFDNYRTLINMNNIINYFNR